MEIKAKRVRMGVAPLKSHPVRKTAPASMVRLALPPGAKMSLPRLFAIDAPGGVLLEMRVPPGEYSAFAPLYKAVKQAGGTFTAF